MNDKIKVPTNFYHIMKWAGIIIIIGGIKLSTQILLPLLIALFISLMLLQPVHWLEKKRIPQPVAIIIILATFSFFIFLLGDVLGKSVSHFSENLPTYKEKFNNYVDRNADTFDVFGIDLSEENLFNSEPNRLMNFIFSGLDQLKQVVGKLFFILLLTLFLLFELDSFPVKFAAIFNRVGKIKAKRNVLKITQNLRSYLGIKTLTSLATGLIIYIFLLIIGVKYAVLWSVLAFLLNYIPNIGSLIAAIPAVIFAGVQLGGSALLWTALMYLGANFVVGSLIEPKIMGKGMGLSTAVILLSLMFWGWLFGPIGMFLSVPLTMVLKVFLETSDSSRYFAILIGTEEEAKEILAREQKAMRSHHKDN